MSISWLTQKTNRSIQPAKFPIRPANREVQGRITTVTCPNQAFILHLIGSGEISRAYKILKAKDGDPYKNEVSETVKKMVESKLLHLNSESPTSNSETAHS